MTEDRILTLAMVDDLIDNYMCDECHGFKVTIDKWQISPCPKCKGRGYYDKKGKKEC